MGVWKSQQQYEKEGRYTPETLPELMSEVYEHEGYMVPYMWAAILIYPFWPSMVNHIAMYRDDFLKEVPKGERFSKSLQVTVSWDFWQRRLGPISN